MNGELKEKHKSTWAPRGPKWLQYSTLMLVVITFIIMVYHSPLTTKMISRMRGVWIEMNRQVIGFASDQPTINNMHLSTHYYDEASLEDYTYTSRSRQALYQGNLTLINGTYPCLLLEKESLVDIEAYKNKSYKLMEEHMALNEVTLTAFNSMMKQFTRATGKSDMIITSAYRSLTEQAKALQEKAELFGDEAALKWAMVPAYSEHHSGYAMDLSIYTDEGEYVSYRGQDEYAWIDAHCHEYGFIRRYADEKQSLTGVVDEQWHYRYVGVPHSYIMTHQNWCLEEYIEVLRLYTFETKHLKVTCEEGSFEIYFVPSTGKETIIPVPKDKPYEISGNNVDGFIVTVEIEED